MLSKEITIHIGLHKTASTFMQKYFFPLYADESGYVEVRKQTPNFLNYILYCNELEFDFKIANTTLSRELNTINFSKQKLIISDEQFCGSPWDNASYRKLYFDRLNGIFPNAIYIIVLRNQNDLIQSLYLQYIKTGGSATWKEFLSHKRHPLYFSLKSYLNYGGYINYMISQVGRERIGCFFYEDMKKNSLAFLKQIASFIGVKTGSELNQIILSNANRSISPAWAKILLHINKFCRSERQPFLLLPRRLHSLIVYFARKHSFSKNRKIIPENEVAMFCEDQKKFNSIIQDIVSRRISNIGY